MKYVGILCMLALAGCSKKPTPMPASPDFQTHAAWLSGPHAPDDYEEGDHWHAAQEATNFTNDQDVNVLKDENGGEL